jgi:4-diphosphocytidyl-2-C-methyl-D-erythritol kinase
MGVRPDGYHELRTIFQTVALHDVLTIRPRRGPFRLICDEPACPGDSTNLVWRGAEALWSAAGRRGALRGYEVTLTKRIPVQAGLGGGSSDAAAAVRAFASLWRVKDDAVRRVAISLGADVPYFLEGGTALGLDRGDALYPLADHPPVWVTLVFPPFGVSTVEAFQWWDEAARRRRPHQDHAARTSNDLQEPVSARYPEIRRIVNALTRAGASHAAMSGSGSAVFGLFGRRDAAERAVRQLRDRTRRIVLTRTVNRAAYQRLAGIAAHRINLPFAPRSPGHS